MAKLSANERSKVRELHEKIVSGEWKLHKSLAVFIDSEGHLQEAYDGITRALYDANIPKKDCARAEVVKRFGLMQRENSKTKILPAQFERCPTEADDAEFSAYFSPFRVFTQTGSQSTAVAVVDEESNTCKLVQIDSKKSLAPLTAACKSAKKLVNGAFVPLTQLYKTELTALLDRAVESLRGREYTEDDIGEILINSGIPREYLASRTGTTLYALLKTLCTPDGDAIGQTLCGLTLAPQPIEFVHQKADELLKHADLILDNVPPALSNDFRELAFHHICLDEEDDRCMLRRGECPAWEEYLQRFSVDEQRVFMAYIWSIFDVSNHGRQMLYLYDSGYTGKSAMLNAVSHWLSDELVMTIQKDSLNNQFAFAKLEGKRLLITPDNKNPYLIRSEKAHMALGGDRAEIEHKGEDSYTARISVKWVASGNVLPQIDTDATHELTRIIILEPRLTEEIKRKICETDAEGNFLCDSQGRYKHKGDPSFTEHLKQQFPQFLYRCRFAYRELCPDNGDIVLPTSLMDRLEMLNDETSININSVVMQSFAIDDAASVEWSMFTDVVKSWESLNGITATEVLSHIQKKHPDVRRISEPSTGVVVVRGLRLIYDEETAYMYSKIIKAGFTLSPHKTVRLSEFWLTLADMCQRGTEEFPYFTSLGFKDTPTKMARQAVARHLLQWLKDSCGVTQTGRAKGAAYLEGIAPKKSEFTQLVQ